MRNILPVEIIFRIICFLGPLDVVRLRTVSKQLRDITYDPLLWKNLYVNAPLPRPPGPFPFQSTRFLEETLVQSAHLAKSWTTQPIAGVEKTLRVDGSTIVPEVICGRWFLTATLKSPMQIVLRSLDSGSFRQVIWEAQDDELVFSWYACSITFPEGQRVYVVLQVGQDIRSPRKLLEFRVNEDSGHLVHCVSLDIPNTSNCGLDERLVGNKAPFLRFLGKGLIFDARTRTFYQFPENNSHLGYTSVLLTPTHVLTFHLSLCPGTTESTTLIRAYVVPSDRCPNDNGPSILRLTHVGTIPKYQIPVTLLRNTTPDHTSGSIKTRILVQQSEAQHVLFSCVDLTLPESTTDVVPLISVDIHNAFTTSLSSLGPLDVLVDASDDGHARGICVSAVHRHPNDHARGSYFEFSTVKFTIDASGDESVVVVGEPSLLQWYHFRAPHLSQTTFDGVRGRLYYFQREWKNEHPDGRLVVRSKAL